MIIYRRQTHAVYHTRYHIVFTTKFRRRLLKRGIGRYLWAIGYFVSTVGINEAIIKKYLMMQGKEDSGQAQLVLP